MNKTFRETVGDAITDFGHQHLVAPPDYDEPDHAEGESCNVATGLRLIALSALLVAGCLVVAALTY